MAILSITTDTTGQININPRIVKIVCNDMLSVITSPGYINPTIIPGGIEPTDVMLIHFATGSLFFNPTITKGIVTLAPMVPSGSANLQSVYYSTVGNDSLGTGTIDNPFATVIKATEYALTLTSSLFFPINVIGDPGEYTATGLTLSPNVNYYANGGSGVFWIGSGKITFNASTFTEAACSISIGGIQIGGLNQSSSFGFNLDSSSLSNFSCTINLNENFVHETASPIFKAGLGHNYLLNLNGYVSLDESGDGGPGTPGPVFDGVFVSANGPHAISPSGMVYLYSTYNGCIFNSVGNIGIGTVNITPSSGNNIEADIYAGYRCELGILTDNFGNLINCQRDETTYLPSASYEGTFGNTIVDQNISPGFSSSTGVSDFYTDTIDFANGFGFIKKQIGYISFPASQIQDMYATPQLLLSAIPGCAIVINQLTFNFVYGGTNQFAGGGLIVAQYGSTIHGAGVSATAESFLGAAGLLTGATNLYQIQQGISTEFSGSGTASSGIINTGIYLSNQSAPFTSGTNNTVFIAIEYNIIPLT